MRQYDCPGGLVEETSRDWGSRKRFALAMDKETSYVEFNYRLQLSTPTVSL